MKTGNKIKNGNKAKAAGIVFLLLFVLLFVIMGINSRTKTSIFLSPVEISAISLLVFSLPFSIIMFIVGGVRSAKARHYQKYLQLIVQVHEIDNIAAITGYSNARIERDLACMMKKGLLTGYTLNRDEKKLVELDSMSVKNGYYRKETAQAGAQTPTRKITVICSGCGAPNDVNKGGTAECEFCGCSLRGE
jgi:uncharacterized integral membrane protein